MHFAPHAEERPGAQAVTRVVLDLTRKDRRAMERMIQQYDKEDEIDEVWVVCDSRAHGVHAHRRQRSRRRRSLRGPGVAPPDVEVEAHCPYTLSVFGLCEKNCARRRVG
jgi:hypothetical protein